MEDIGKVSELREGLKIHGETIQIGGFRFLGANMHMTSGASFDDWRKAGIFVQRQGKSGMWWLGDWVLAGESKFSEEAAQFVDSQHFAESSLKKARWVCEAIAPDRRVEELSFEHHAAVSRLKDSREQDRWLKKAVKQKWNPTDLRRAMRDADHTKRYVEQEMPEGKYRVLYVDPPWEYGDRGGSNADELAEYTGAARHYPTMSLQQIVNLPVRDLVGKNGALFLWIPAPLLPDAFEVISAWGFIYKTNIVWDKELPNPGHYLSIRHEHLILATRGKMIPDSPTVQGIDSVQVYRRSETHSEKPAAFRDLIDTLYPSVKSGDRLEMFAREDPNRPEHWKTWGNEELAAATSSADEEQPADALPEPTPDGDVQDAGDEQAERDKDRNKGKRTRHLAAVS